MTLIASISGIRGTMGGRPSENLTPLDIVTFASAFAVWIRRQSGKKRPRVVVGRDARLSGQMVSQLVCGSLMGSGIDVLELGMATTPTVEIAVIAEKADGGIILSASHNPGNWNALKLLNHQGEFISAATGAELLEATGQGQFDYALSDQLGRLGRGDLYHELHISQIMGLDLVDRDAIGRAGFRVALDGINSVGGLVIPSLLKRLGVREVFELNCAPTGVFAHDPEPLEENLKDISVLVQQRNADLGLAVDPDADRLVILDEHGKLIGEEYTLVTVADYVLKNNPGNTVSNLSSSRALKDVTEKYGGNYIAAPVGEVNVVEAMKRHKAVIGGEGNGGIIYPRYHYGRDALVGIALFLSHLATSGLSCSRLRSGYPDYFISKNKIRLEGIPDAGGLLERIAKAFSPRQVNRSDGVRIDFEKEWVHLRTSNTEPVVRVIAESTSMEGARRLAREMIERISTP